MKRIHEIIIDVQKKLLAPDCDIVECLKKARHVSRHFDEKCTFLIL
ncbi:MAG: hypothetical protein ACFFCM_12440 [Promethearchaeota archaeon]